MTDHECKYEREWGQQLESTKEISKAVNEIKECTVTIKKSVNKLVTQTEVHKTYFKLIAGVGGPILLFLTARIVWAWLEK